MKGIGVPRSLSGFFWVMEPGVWVGEVAAADTGNAGEAIW